MFSSGLARILSSARSSGQDRWAPSTPAPNAGCRSAVCSSFCNDSGSLGCFIIGEAPTSSCLAGRRLCVHRVLGGVVVLPLRRARVTLGEIRRSTSNGAKYVYLSDIYVPKSTDVSGFCPGGRGLACVAARMSRSYPWAKRREGRKERRGKNGGRKQI